MEYLKTLFKEANSEDLNYSYGSYQEIPNTIDCEINLFEENDHKFQNMDITLKNNIDNYGNMMAEYYIKKVKTRFSNKGINNRRS